MKLKAPDRKWASSVKERESYVCQRCGHEPASRGLHAHHIFTRSRKPTRLDLQNGVSLCYGCHRWAHSNPLEFHSWAKGLLGEEEYEALQRRSLGREAR